jgi:hypothetical protein
MDGEDQCLNNKTIFTYDFLDMVDFGIVKWHNHKSLEFDGMDFFKILNHCFKITLI